MSARTFTVQYENGVSEAERGIERKEIVSGWVGDQAATANRDDFTTNRVTVAQFRDGLAAGDGNVEGLSTAGACVSFWAGNIAGLPLHVQRKVNGVDTPYPEHPLYWILHDSPNFDQSAFDFWEYMIESLEWRGNAYAQIARRGDGNISSLTPIAPDTVRVSRQSNGENQGRDARYQGRGGGARCQSTGQYRPRRSVARRIAPAQVCGRKCRSS